MLDKNDMRTGNRVHIRRSCRTPLAGRSGVILLTEPDDLRGTYLVQFEDGLQFQYDRQDLQLLAAPCSFPERVVSALLRFARSPRV